MSNAMPTSAYIPETRQCAHWRETAGQRVLQLLQLEPSSKLPNSQTCDVIIIGGGIAGLSTAVALTELGIVPILLERASEIGKGASGQNAGILSAGVNMPLVSMPPDSPAADLWAATSNLIHELYDRASSTSAILQASKTGSLSLARSQTALKRLIKEAKARSAIGLKAQTITADTVRKITGDRLSTSHVQGALWLPDEGRIHPLTLLAQLVSDATGRGCKMYGDADVVHYKHDGSSWSITLSDGKTLISKALVRAIGPTVRPTSRIYALAFPIDLPESFPLFWDAAPYVYYDYRPGNGFLTVSGGPYGLARQVDSDRNFHHRMAAETRQWIPELSASDPSHCWAVDLDVASDLLPTISRLNSDDSGLAIDGLGALGVLPGIILGRQAAGRIFSSIS